MDMVTIPSTLFMAYGGLVLSCGVVLGIIFGRNLRRRNQPRLDSPDPLAKRVELLEAELDALRSEIERSHVERDFMRQLRAEPAKPESSIDQPRNARRRSA